jgi:hypothetical protein
MTHGATAVNCSARSTSGWTRTALVEGGDHDLAGSAAEDFLNPSITAISNP